MNWQNVWKLAQSDYVKLVPVLALAFYITYIPHLNYSYPVHIDEWVHLAYSEAIQESANVVYVDPFYGKSLQSLSSNLETGFQLFWAVFQSISGISWLTIFRYFPGVIFMLTVLSVYVMAKREGFGWEAAFFACLVPTAVGIMGPAFLIPVAMGLLFLPPSLFIVLNYRTVWSYLVLFMFILFLLAIHAPSAISVVIVLAPFILLNLKGDFKHSLMAALALAVPFLMTLPWTASLILSTARSLVVPQPLPAYHSFLTIMTEYGHLPILACLLGVFVLATKGGKRNYSLVLGLLLLVAMLAIFYTLHYGVAMMYLRGLLFTMLMMSIIAGAGLMTLRKLELPLLTDLRLKKPLIIQTIGILLCLIFVGATVAVAIPDRQAIPYYRMIDQADYEAFVWIKENVGKDYDRAILDPWKATAFTAITGKHIHTRIHTAPVAKDDQAYDFIRNGSTNTTFLRQNGISIIYTRIYDGVQGGNTDYNANNPDLTEVAKNIYLLKESKE